MAIDNGDDTTTYISGAIELTTDKQEPDAACLVVNGMIHDIRLSDLLALVAQLPARNAWAPPATIPAPQLPRAILISPALEGRSGNGDLCVSPVLARDTAGRLWVGFEGRFENPIDDEDGSYIGPRPVVEVTPLPALAAVAVTTDQDTFIIAAAEWATFAA